MSDIVKKLLKSSIENTFGNDFEKFVQDFFLVYYGPVDFTTSRRVKDGGSDGFVNREGAIAACYGPEHKAGLAQFKKKINDDHTSYTANWRVRYPRFWCVHNRVNSPDYKKYLDSIGTHTSLIGVEELIYMFDEMNRAKQRKVAGYLRIDPDHFNRQYVKEIIEDILSECESELKERIPYEKPTYIEKKFQLNFNQQQLDEVIGQFEDAIEDFDVLIDVLGDYEEEGSLRTLKNRILTDLSLIQGDLYLKINSLVSTYSVRFDYSDDYLVYIRSLLLYLFEQCLFGVKTETEKKENS